MAKSAPPIKTQDPETCTHYYRTYTTESGMLMRIVCNTCGLVLWERVAPVDLLAWPEADLLAALEGRTPF